MMSTHGSAAAAFARLQHGDSPTRPETKSDTPDGPAAPTLQGPPPQPPATREALAAALAGLVPRGGAQPLADALAACLDGNALHLTRLDDGWASQVGRLSPQAWALLDGLAGVGGILRVTLPQVAHGDELELLAQGMAMLPRLETLDLPVPRNGAAIDLSALRACPRPLLLRLHCTRVDGWRITVPQGCRVRAVGPAARRHHLLKPKVSYVDSHGHPAGESHALPGVPYMAKPPSSIVEACKGDTKAARQAALALCMNGRAQFDGKGVDAAADPADRTIWCRHIAVQVGRDWRVRRGLQQVGMPATMSYEPYSTPESLGAHVGSETQSCYTRDLSREAVAVFTDRGLGEALQVQFEGLLPGQDRAFLLVTMNHAMTLEIRRKGPHCVVTCYDPNVSTLPLKLLVSDPSHLHAYSMRDLLGSVYGHYVPLAAFVSGAMFATGPDSERGSAPCVVHGFSPDVMASREGLYWLLRSGATAGIERSVEAIVASAGGKDIPILLARLSAMNEGYSGLVDALFWKREETVDAYVRALWRHALPVVGEEGVARLLNDVLPAELGPAEGSK